MLRARRHIAIALGATLALLGATVGATPALGANADACGTITQHTLAKAFELSKTIEHKALLREPGDPSGVIQERCNAFAYTGAKPTSSAKRRASLLAGTGAEVKIETWVADSGPSAEVWLANFDRKLEALKKQAKTQYVEGLGGSTYQPARFGAEGSAGYRGNAGALRKARVIWWQRSSGTLIVMSAVEAKSKPLPASLLTLGATIVPGVL